MSKSHDQGTITVDAPSSNPGSESPRGNSGGSGGNKGNNGSHNNNKGNSSVVSRAAGDTLARSFGINPQEFTGYYIDGNGDIIAEVSLSSPAVPTVDGYRVGVNLGPLPPGLIPNNNGTTNNGKKAGSNPGGLVTISFRGDTSDARIAALNKIISANAPLVNSGHSGQRIVRAKQATWLAQAELVVINNARKQKDAEDRARKEQEELARQREKEAAEKASAERETLSKTSGLIADVGDRMGEYLGDKYKSLANEIANDIKNFQGKNIRSYDQAMASLSKVTSNPAMKINKADKDAIVNAWKHVDAQDMANKLSNLGKAFKIADRVMKVEKVRQKSIEGYETGNWGPLILEVESWVLGGIAASLALGFFSATIGLALLYAGVPAIAVGISGIMFAAIVGALIDDNVADKLNQQIIRPAN